MPVDLDEPCVIEYDKTRIPNIATAYFKSIRHTLVCKKSLIEAPRIGNKLVILLDHEYIIVPKRYMHAFENIDVDYHKSIYPYDPSILIHSYQDLEEYSLINNGYRNGGIISNEVDNYAVVKFVDSNEIDDVYGTKVSHADCVSVEEYDHTGQFSYAHMSIILPQTIENIVSKIKSDRGRTICGIQHRILIKPCYLDFFMKHFFECVKKSEENSTNLIVELATCSDLKYYLGEIVQEKTLILESMYSKEIRKFL